MPSSSGAAPLVALPNSHIGASMPLLALGTWRADAGTTTDAVIAAIRDCGYRAIDTANDYGNEHEVGAGIRFCLDNGIVKRDELFVQAKLWNANMRPDLVRLDLLATLRDLQLDYVDSWVIHWPMCAPADPRAEKPVLAWNVAHQTRAQLEAELEADLKFLQKNAAKTDPSTGSIFTHIPDHTNNIQTSAAKETMFPVEDDLYLFDAKVHFTDTWKAMEKLVDEGLVRHLGISNFNFAQIQELLRVGCEKYKPAVLQNEVHLYLQAKDMLDFCRAHGIQLQAYSPLGSNPTGELPKPNAPKYSIRDHPDVVAMGEKYGKSAPQVALRYLLQRGIAVVAKSIAPTRIAMNMQLWDFELGAADMEVLAGMNCGHRNLLWPQVAGHPDYPFKEWHEGGVVKVPESWLSPVDPRQMGG